MWIEKLDVYGFGMLQNVAVELGRGLNVIAAENGKGKTTLLHFIRACLFGFSTRGSVERYELDRQAFRGGRLLLCSEGERVQVERVPKGRSAGTLHINRHDGSPADERFLNELLGGMSRSVYQQVFALGLDELSRLDVFSRDELRSHLLSVGLHAADSIAMMDKQLQSERDALFKPRGQQPLLNKRLRTVEEVKSRLSEAEQREEAFTDADKRLAALETDVAELTSQLNSLAAKAEGLRAQIEAWPHWLQWQKVSKERAALDYLKAVSDRIGGEKASEALHRFQRLRSERVWTADAVNSAEDQLWRWQERIDKLENQRQNLLPEPLQAVQPSERKTLLNQCSTLQRKMKASMLPWGWMAAAGAVYTGALFYWLLWGSGSLWWSVLTLMPLVTAAAVGAVRLNGCRRLQKELRRFEPFFGRAPVDTTVWQTRLNEEERRQQEWYDLKQQLDDASHTFERAEEKADSVEGRYQEWMVSLGADSEEEAEETLQQICQYESLTDQVQRLAGAVEYTLGVEFLEAERMMTAVEKADIEKELSGVGGRCAQLEMQRRQCLEERGRLQKELEDMENQGRVDHWRRRLMEEQNRAQPELQRLAAIAVLQQAVEKARQEFETTRQPQLLRNAGLWFAAFTKGSYQRVYVPLQERQIKAEDADGFVWNAERLSRGTVEQLYLALRFALIQYYADSGVVLPVLLDEILVNFDPTRTVQVLDGLRQLANTHQILLLTCKEDVVEMVQECKEGTICRPFQS